MVHRYPSFFAAAAAIALLPLTVYAHAHEGLGFHITHQERAMNEPYFAQLKRRYGEAPARVVDLAGMARRQATTSMTSSAIPSASALVQGAATATSLTSGTIPIDTTTTLETTSPLPTTYAAAATAPISGAPTLPNVVIDPTEWPTLDKVPPLNSTQVQQWISEIDWSSIPDIPVNQLGGCANASNANATTNAAANGWWTCGGHTRSSDVVSCPQKNTWGLSYDDGPSPDTPRLLDYLVEKNLKSTFFIVGSRAISRPQMLQYEYMASNQVCVHTWSHPYLTTKTSDEIVAELGWTKYAMKQILGVTPNTMRPPYGDIDDRVRAISLAMGLTPIIWTSINATSDFDTMDWEVAGGVVTADAVVSRFEAIIDQSSNIDTGFIVLEHDLYQQSTSLAIEYLLPYALNKTNPALTIEPIYQCLGLQMSDVYIETASNKTGAGATSTVVRNSTATNAPVNAAGASKSGGSSSSSSSSPKAKSAASHGTAPALMAALATVLAGLFFYAAL